MIGTIMVWKTGTTTTIARCIMDYLLLPLFIIQVVASYIIATILLFYAGANAGECIVCF